jgi:hypothetical protein
MLLDPDLRGMDLFLLGNHRFRKPVILPDERIHGGPEHALSWRDHPGRVFFLGFQFRVKFFLPYVPSCPNRPVM